MDKKTMMYLGIGVGAAALIYFMMRRKDEPMGPGSRMMDPTLDPTMTPPAPSYTNNIAISNASGLGLYKWYGVESKDRAKFDASAQIGTSGMINGSQPCTINDFWIDGNGKKGAFRCEEISVGNYDIPGGSRLEY
tara:strand:- start:631 stop:1035 length:405 start_codon:yes stop_codon:yes gene_type:complete